MCNVMGYCNGVVVYVQAYELSSLELWSSAKSEYFT